MKRINTSADVAATGLVQVDAGIGVQFAIPVASEGAEYRSGLRDVSGELMNGWTGSLFVEREGGSVFFRGQLDGSEATSDIAWMLPAGFRPGFLQSAGGPIDYGTGWAINSATTPTARRINHYLHRFQIVGGNGGTGSAALWNINYVLRTRETAPTTPPGDPA